jgi:hypothetical protein
MDCLASLAMTWLSLNTTPRSRGAMRPRFLKIIRPEVRGRRECRVLAAPAVSCAKMCKERTRAYRYRRGHPDIPCAMVLRLMARSPRRRIRLVTVVGELAVLSNPVGLAKNLRRLDTSNGCQDHTVLPYAATRLRQKARRAMAPSSCALLSAHGKPPCEQPARRRCRVHRIPSRVRDDRDTPLLPGKDGASW